MPLRLHAILPFFAAIAPRRCASAATPLMPPPLMPSMPPPLFAAMPPPFAATPAAICRYWPFRHIRCRRYFRFVFADADYAACCRHAAFRLSPLIIAAIFAAIAMISRPPPAAAYFLPRWLAAAAAFAITPLPPLYAHYAIFRH
jgi:hypothetical protein